VGSGPAGSGQLPAAGQAPGQGGATALIKGSRDLDAAIKGTDFDRPDLLPADFTYRNLDLVLDATKKPTQRLDRLLRPVAAEYDLIVLDCPPSISLLSESVLHAADILLVRLIATTLSVRTLGQLSEFISGFDRRRPRVLAFCSMIDRRKRLHREIAERLPEERSDVARTVIPALSLIERMSLERALLVCLFRRVGGTMPWYGHIPASSGSRLYFRVSSRVQAAAHR
jgi:chromosome partitioning protein